MADRSTDGPFQYRPEIIETLWRYGIHPTSETRPELVREFVSDLYRHEIRCLRERLLKNEFPKREYAARVEALRNRYQVLSLLPHQLVGPP